MHLEVVASALKSSPSYVSVLDLSRNALQNSAVDLLCAGLKSRNCRLEVLRSVSPLCLSKFNTEPRNAVKVMKLSGGELKGRIYRNITRVFFMHNVFILTLFLLIQIRELQFVRDQL